MISRKVRNLVLLSRSAIKSEKIAALVEKLREIKCCRVLSISCDVASEDDLAQAMYICGHEKMSPIRSVVYVAFVLSVSDERILYLIVLVILYL